MEIKGARAKFPRDIGFDDLPVMQHGDPISDCADDSQVQRNKDSCNVMLSGQIADQVQAQRALLIRQDGLKVGCFDPFCGSALPEKGRLCSHILSGACLPRRIARHIGPVGGLDQHRLWPVNSTRLTPFGAGLSTFGCLPARRRCFQGKPIDLFAPSGDRAGNLHATRKMPVSPGNLHRFGVCRAGCWSMRKSANW